MDSYGGKELKETLNNEHDRTQLFASVGAKLGTEVGTMLDELVDGLEEIEENESGELSYQDFFKYYMKNKKNKKTDTTNNDDIAMDLAKENEKKTNEEEEETGDFNLNDYILKTQIVPPVCPTCPACNNCSGTCTNCGGNGGSGTLKIDGSSNVIEDAVSQVQKIDAVSYTHLRAHET